MSFTKANADADLAAIDDMVRRVRQSRIYRVAGEIAILWGLLQLVQYPVSALAPAARGWSWIAIDALGVALTVGRLASAGLRGQGRAGRALAAFALFYGFGFIWSAALSGFGPHETAVFWHTLFLFGYCLAGLWFGVGFMVIGLTLTALTLAVYAFAGVWFWPLIALVSGFGYILCGLWMRRA